MSANLAALLYLVSGALFIMALRGLVLARHLAPGQHLRHGRHDHRHADDAGDHAAVAHGLWS